MRIIKECDAELEMCDAAEREATDRISAYERNAEKQTQGVDSIPSSTPDTETSEISEENENDESFEVHAEDELMMDVNLVQKGAWQRVNARVLLTTLATRKLALNHRLATARTELSIMIQAVFGLAAPHVQRVSRRFLVRLRLDKIRMSVLDFARFSAAVEIQRIVRSRLASIEEDRLRKLRDHLMATKLQSIARRRSAIAEMRRRKAEYVKQLRNRAAILIQASYRCYSCKLKAQLLAEERRRRLEAAEKARVGEVRKHSAIVIQKHCRRILSKEKCSNRRIELGLHQRLLMYLERYTVDGCMWSFVKSINDDYKRYERTIIHTIEREEKMAKTFVEKVPCTTTTYRASCSLH